MRASAAALSARGAALALALALALGCDGAPTRQAPPDVGPRPDAGAADASPPDAALARLLHVAPGASPDAADGRRDHPFPTLQAAYEAARPGDTVLLLPGDHGPAIAPPDGVALWGSGAINTTLQGPLVLRRAGADVRSLTVLGGEPAVTVRASASLGAVDVRAGVGEGLRVEGDAVLEDVRVVDTRAPDGAEPPAFGPEGPSAGAAVQVASGGRLTWRGGGVAGAWWMGVRSAGGALTLDDVAVTDPGGPGVFVEGGTLVARALVVERAVGAGVRLLDAEGDLTDLRIVDVAYASDQGTGTGVGFVGGAGRVTRLTVVGGERGLRVAGGAVVEGTGVDVRDGTGSGVGVAGAEARLTDVRIERMANGGLQVGQGGALAVERVVVIDVRRYGLLASQASVEVTGLRIEGSAARGVTLLGANARLDDVEIVDAADVAVQITDPPAEGGVHVGALTVRGARGAGVAVFGRGGAPVEIEDAEIEGTRPGDGDLADGVQLFDAKAHLRRVTVRRNDGAGILVERGDAVLEAVEAEANGGPGLVVVEPTGPVLSTGLVARGNGGQNVLVLGGLVELQGGALAEALPDPAEGAGDGLVAAQSATVVLRGVTVRGNGRHGAAALARSALRIEGNHFERNHGFGVQVGCDGSSLADEGGNTYAGNADGERGGCP